MRASIAVLIASLAVVTASGAADAKPSPRPHAMHGMTGGGHGAHNKCKMKNCPKTNQKAIQP